MNKGTTQPQAKEKEKMEQNRQGKEISNTRRKSIGRKIMENVVSLLDGRKHENKNDYC
jgi:hypothetical protein